METTTIVGIVIAVIIMVLGIRMMFRKPADAAPSLESELHVDPESQKPVIPRHVRSQLNTADAPRVEPTLAEQPAETEQTLAAAEEKVEVQPVADSTETAELKPTEAESAASKPVVDPAVVAENIAETHVEQAESVAAKAVNEVPVENTAPVAEKAAEFSVNANIEKAEISDFDEESSILDAHLHEQKIVDEESALATAETYIALNVFPDSRALSGEKALKVLLKYGLRFGEMACFHRYDEEGSKLLFSVLQINNDGAAAGFDLETLSTEEVKGLAFFLALPHSDVQNAFDTMDSISRLIAREIDGTVYDQNNQEFTAQMREHWRHQAIDYRQGQALEA